MKSPLFLGIIIVGIIAVAAWLVFGGDFPSLQPTMSITTANGVVEVSDIYTSPVERFGENDLVLARSEHYEIVYYAADKSFAIAIKNKPLQAARDAAQRELLRILTIPQDEACNLSVSLTVLGSVDLALAGQNYGLSFCPQGIPFPSSN